MDRVPRSARSRVVRRLKIGAACLLALPTGERIMRSVTRHGILGLVPTGMQLIGILASVCLVYATMSEWQGWKIAFLTALIIVTLIVLGLYLYARVGG